MKIAGKRYFCMTIDDIWRAHVRSKADGSDLHNNLQEIEKYRKQRVSQHVGEIDAEELNRVELVQQIEGLRRKNAQLSETINGLEKVLSERNKDLQALGYINCSGGCYDAPVFKDKTPEEAKDLVRRCIYHALRIHTFACNYYYRKGTRLKWSMWFSWTVGMLAHGLRTNFFKLKYRMRR